MLEMLLDRQGESEQVRDELIGASLSHVASLRQPRGGAKAPKVLYRPLSKYLARGWSALWSRKFESLPARPASPGSATIGPGQMSCGASRPDDPPVLGP